MSGGLLGGEFAEDVESFAECLRVVLLLHFIKNSVYSVLVRGHDITIICDCKSSYLSHADYQF